MAWNQLRQRGLLPQLVARGVAIGQSPQGWGRLAHLGAAAGLVAAVTTVTAQAVSPRATSVGRQRDGAVVVPTDQTLTPAGHQVEFAGHQVEFAGRLNAVALSPTGAKAAFLTAGAKPITVVDLATGTVAQQFDPGDTSASFDGFALQRQGAFFVERNGTWRDGSHRASSVRAIRHVVALDLHAPTAVGAAGRLVYEERRCDDR